MRKARLSDEDIRTIQEMDARGVAKKEIARQFEITPKAVRYWVGPEVRQRRLTQAEAYRKRQDVKAREQDRSKRRGAQKKAERKARHIAGGWWMPEEGDPVLWKKACSMVGGSMTQARKALTRRWVYDKLVAGLCEVTGKPFVYEKWHLQSPELDRIIPGCQGGTYTIVNTQVVCRGYNTGKNGRSDEEAKAFFGLSPVTEYT